MYETLGKGGAYLKVSGVRNVAFQVAIFQDCRASDVGGSGYVDRNDLFLGLV